MRIRIQNAAMMTVLLIAANSVLTTRTIGAQENPETPFLVVLGNAQDGGAPQAGTKEDAGWTDPSYRHLVVSLGLVDPGSGQRWMFEATPDFREELHLLDDVFPVRGTPGLAGVFLTHAHIGHYTGLMFLGHESMGASGVRVYAMPRMADFLAGNGPWSQLVNFGNIDVFQLSDGEAIAITPSIYVTAFLVPHRQEYSEVVGYRIEGPTRSVLFIPDIDSWEELDATMRIEDLIADVDVAYVDGSFFANGEIPGRDMSGFPHPFISHSMERFAALPASERAKVRFIHLNNTNPALDPNSSQSRMIRDAGFNVAREGERIGL